MKEFVVILTLLLNYFSCNQTGEYGQALKVISDDNFLNEVNDSTKSTKQILDKYLPNILIFAKTHPTQPIFYGDNVVEDDNVFRKLLVGKPIDTSKIIATEINLKDSTISFFQLDKKVWKLIGTEKTVIDVYKIDFDDLNGDGKKEIITSTSFNMNGNSWQRVYLYSNKTDNIKYAGSFSTLYEIKKDKKQIEETYGGSFYMDESKTLYGWRKEMLVPLRKIIISRDTADPMNGRLSFEYYNNTTDKIEGLKLKYKLPYNDQSKKLQLVWDNFFSP